MVDSFQRLLTLYGGQSRIGSARSFESKATGVDPCQGDGWWLSTIVLLMSSEMLCPPSVLGSLLVVHPSHPNNSRYRKVRPYGQIVTMEEKETKKTEDCRIFLQTEDQYGSCTMIKERRMNQEVKDCTR